MNSKWACRLLPAFAVILVAGCASAGRNLVRDGIVEVEKVSSREATIMSVQVIQKDSEVSIRGQIYRRHLGRGPIPGHIDVELIGPDGGVRETGRIGYRMRSAKSRYADFYVLLKTMPSAGSTLRVIHDANPHGGANPAM